MQMIARKEEAFYHSRSLRSRSHGQPLRATRGSILLQLKWAGAGEAWEAGGTDL